MRRLPAIEGLPEEKARILYCFARLWDTNDGRILAEYLKKAESEILPSAISSKDYADKVGFSGAVEAIWDLQELFNTARDSYNLIQEAEKTKKSKER